MHDCAIGVCQAFHAHKCDSKAVTETLQSNPVGWKDVNEPQFGMVHIWTAASLTMGRASSR